MGFVVLAVGLLLAVVATAGVVVVAPDGVCKPVAQLEKKMSENAASEGHSVGAIGVLDPDGSPVSLAMCNKIFGASFADNEMGLSLSPSDDGVVLRSNFNALAGPGFTAVKALELFNALSAPTAVVVVAGNIDEFRSKYERLMRIVVREASSPLLVALGGAVDASVASDVERELLQLHRDENGDEASPLEVVVVRADGTDDGAVVRTLRSAPRRLAALSAAELSQKWALASKRATSHLDKEQQRSLFAISRAFLDCQKAADEVLALMRRRVEKNKVVASFGKRVGQLLDSALADYAAGVRDTALVVEATERARDLRATILASALEMLQQQLLVLERSSATKLRRGLTQLYTAHEAPAKDLVEQVVRRVAADYDAAAAALENAAVSLVAHSPDEFEARLLKEAQEFPGSAAHKLIAIRRAEKQVAEAPKKRRRAKGGWLSWLKVSATLVGMLRPAGVGNFQGYVNYRAAVLGRPLDLLLGVQNDGDAPEIVGEDREHPLLRLQPKFHFDIDL